MTSYPMLQHNRLLAALPADVAQRLEPHLEPVPLALGKVLYESGDAPRHVYFPIEAVVSMQYTMRNGASLEIAKVGNEGLVGLSLFTSGQRPPSRAVVQSAGTTFRILGARLRAEFDRHGELMGLMLRYTQAMLTQMAQIAVCNRHHTIDQQLCRWLLLSLDRLPTNQLIMTQELIANSLGVRREGVTEAARKLQKRQVIEYSRGRIVVLDRAKLEQLSCECYAQVQQETDRLLPLPASYEAARYGTRTIETVRPLPYPVPSAIPSMTWSAAAAA